MADVWADPYYGQGDKVKLLVALAIADSANSDTGLAWPSLETLCSKARTSIRGAQDALRQLKADGKLEIEVGKGRNGTNLYRMSPRTVCIPAEETQITPPHSLHPATAAPRKRAAEKAAEKAADFPAAVCTQSIRNHHYPSGTEGTVTTKPEEFKEAWNALPDPFPKCRSMSEDRKTALRCRLKDAFWLENWRAALEMMPSVPFLRGENNRRWIADVDFFLRAASVTKIIENKYGEKNGAIHSHNGLVEDFSHLVPEEDR